MPIVIDFSPVNALGSLAMQTGEAQGRAQGNRDFIARQTAVDQQAFDANQRNREIATQVQQAPITETRQANQREFEQQQNFARATQANREQQKNAIDLENLRAVRAQETQDFQLFRQEQGIAQREADRFATDKARKQEQDKRLRESLIRTGKSESEVQRIMDEVTIAQATRTGQFGPANTQTPTVPAQPKRPSGSLESFGFQSAADGTLPDFTDQLLSTLSFSNDFIPVSQIKSKLKSGAFDFWSSPSTPIEEVQKALNDPNIPAWARAEAGRAIAARPDVLFGINQSPAPTPPATQPQSQPPSPPNGSPLSGKSVGELLTIARRGLRG